MTTILDELINGPRALVVDTSIILAQEGYRAARDKPIIDQLKRYRSAKEKLERLNNHRFIMPIPVQDELIEGAKRMFARAEHLYSIAASFSHPRKRRHGLEFFRFGFAVEELASARVRLVEAYRPTDVEKYAMERATGRTNDEVIHATAVELSKDQPTILYTADRGMTKLSRKNSNTDALEIKLYRFEKAA